MSRKAFLGLSSPLAYDYKPHQSRIHSKDASAPNPILEDSMGLLLFYDEIVFLSRQLCPENMRSLEYVSFLTDRDDFARRIDVTQLPDLEKADHPLGDNDFRSMFDIFADVISMITGQPHLVNSDEDQFIIDYHTHQFYLTNTINFRASSTDFRAIYTDWEIISQFDLHDCDPIYNSANARYYDKIVRPAERSNRQIAIAQELIVKHLPNYLGPYGPYHECIEELREHRFLSDLRTYLDELVSNGTKQEIADIASEMERLAKEFQGRVFQKHLSSRVEYFTIGKATITDAIGLVIPGAGIVTELVELYFQRRQRNKMRWAGFLAELPVGLRRTSRTSGK